MEDGDKLEDENGDSGRERRFDRSNISDGVVSRGGRKQSVLQVERKHSGEGRPRAFRRGVGKKKSWHPVISVHMTPGHLRELTLGAWCMERYLLEMVEDRGSHQK